ncbi:ATPase [candidate division KSB1 bacterium]|nr:MAG: ATPase [candidate division KSB1 bacterium]
MKRAMYQQLLTWKKSRHRKPLLLQGARQVGKTFLINEFGKNEYSNFIYLNFEQNAELHTLFTGNLEPSNIIGNISLYLNQKINSSDTLIFFDEIQTAPDVLTSLKYFYEHAPEYHIIAAGSLLGVSVGKKSSFPVGKVTFLTLYPMSFKEYLTAFDQELIAEKLNAFQYTDSFPEIIHQKLLKHLKMYLYLGGMPEVLNVYLKENDISLARKIQLDILEAYKRDFSKYADSSQAIKTFELWHSIPYQLAKENKKFKYSDVRKNARSATFENTIHWLKNTGLINIAYNIKVPKIPLSGYADYSKFKLYLLDSGLLGAMLNISPEIIIKPNALFSEYNGAFIENFVASELISAGIKNLYYWTSKSDAEVDFVIEQGGNIYPLEVKSGTNRNIKSLRSYAEKFNPKFIIRTSPRNFTIDNDFINIPLYAICIIKNLIGSTDSAGVL